MIEEHHGHRTDVVFVNDSNLAGLDSRDGVCKADLTLSTQGRRETYLFL